MIIRAGSSNRAHGRSVFSTVLELRTIAAFCDDFVTKLRADVFSYGIPVLVGMHTRGEYDVGSAAGAT